MRVDFPVPVPPSTKTTSSQAQEEDDPIIAQHDSDDEFQMMTREPIPPQRTQSTPLKVTTWLDQHSRERIIDLKKKHEKTKHEHSMMKDTKRRLEEDFSQVALDTEDKTRQAKSPTQTTVEHPHAAGLAQKYTHTKAAGAIPDHASDEIDPTCMQPNPFKGKGLMRTPPQHKGTGSTQPAHTPTIAKSPSTGTLERESRRGHTYEEAVYKGQPKSVRSQSITRPLRSNTQAPSIRQQIEDQERARTAARTAKSQRTRSTSKH